MRRRKEAFISLSEFSVNKGECFLHSVSGYHEGKVFFPLPHGNLRFDKDAVLSVLHRLYETAAAERGEEGRGIGRRRFSAT